MDDQKTKAVMKTMGLSDYNSIQLKRKQQEAEEEEEQQQQQHHKRNMNHIIMDVQHTPTTRVSCPHPLCSCTFKDEYFLQTHWKKFHLFEILMTKSSTTGTNIGTTISVSSGGTVTHRSSSSAAAAAASTQQQAEQEQEQAAAVIQAHAQVEQNTRENRKMMSSPPRLNLNRYCRLMKDGLISNTPTPAPAPAPAPTPVGMGVGEVEMTVPSGAAGTTTQKPSIGVEGVVPWKLGYTRQIYWQLQTGFSLPCCIPTCSCTFINEENRRTHLQKFHNAQMNDNTTTNNNTASSSTVSCCCNKSL